MKHYSNCNTPVAGTLHTAQPGYEAEYHRANAAPGEETDLGEAVAHVAETTRNTPGSISTIGMLQCDNIVTPV
jgi:hypothetical protein